MRPLAHWGLKHARWTMTLLDFLETVPTRRLRIRKLISLFVQSPDTPLFRGFACTLKKMTRKGCDKGFKNDYACSIIADTVYSSQSPAPTTYALFFSPEPPP